MSPRRWASTPGERSPAAWLLEFIEGLADAGDLNGVTVIARDLAARIDHDTIQDLYQPQMDEDGYVRDLDLGACAECGERRPVGAMVRVAGARYCADCALEVQARGD